MKKKELVSALAEKEGLTKKQAASVVDSLTDLLTQALVDGAERVSLGSLGVLVTRDRAARNGRNPQTGAPLTISARKAVALKPSKALKDAVNG